MNGDSFYMTEYDVFGGWNERLEKITTRKFYTMGNYSV